MSPYGKWFVLLCTSLLLQRSEVRNHFLGGVSLTTLANPLLGYLRVLLAWRSKERSEPFAPDVNHLDAIA